MNVKPGYKTTELAAAALVAVGALVAAIADKLPARYAAIASSVSVGCYAISRGLAKFGSVPSSTSSTSSTGTQPPAA